MIILKNELIEINESPSHKLTISHAGEDVGYVSINSKAEIFLKLTKLIVANTTQAMPYIF